VSTPRTSPLFWMSASVIAAALLLGGGSRAGFLGDVVVQLLAVPLLVLGLRDWVIRMIADLRARSLDALLHLAILLMLGLLALQLINWPQWLAPPLPGGAKALVSESSSLLMGDAHPFSVAPAASWAAAVSLIPCFAMLCGVSQLSDDARFKLALVLVGLGALSLLVGFVQIVQGPESGWRFFATTNPSEAVGFFANRNHFAALLYSTLILTAVWFAHSTNAFLKLRTLNTHAILWFVLFAIVVIAVLAGVMMARSRAGLVLAGVAVAGIILLLVSSRTTSRRGRNNSGHAHNRLVLAGVIFAILFAVQFGAMRILTRFDADPLEDLRLVLSPTTVALAQEAMPSGTGLGSFVPVYASIEKTQHLFSGFANRAHNDWAEFALETGLLGLIAGALFLAWWCMRSIRIMRRKRGPDFDPHRMLRQGASLIILLLLCHSVVDYPLRTTSLSVIFAFCCAILISPINRFQQRNDQLVN
jgi:O-Antigen ligase